MLQEKLKDYKIILASGSPRRQAFFRELNVDFKISVRKVKETFPSHLKGHQITDYLSQLKASAFPDLKENEILITSDTLVLLNGKTLGKPRDYEEAAKMLHNLSGKMHEVITSVTFTSSFFQKTVHDTTKVWFRNLTDLEIRFYIEKYEPYDKAGSYGIQEWIGYIGIEKIEGCYFNVMGLPIRLVYDVLNHIAKT